MNKCIQFAPLYFFYLRINNKQLHIESIFESLRQKQPKSAANEMWDTFSCNMDYSKEFNGQLILAVCTNSIETITGNRGNLFK